MATDNVLAGFTPDDWNLRQTGDWIASNTIGLVWRSASGTVDPWTKDGMIDAAARDRAQAKTANPNPQPTQQDYEEVTSEITQILKMNKADPTDFDLIANNPGLVALVDILKSIGWILVAAGAAYVIVQLVGIAKVAL